MAGYGRFIRARKSSRTSRFPRRRVGSRRRYGGKKTMRPRFATVGFTRNIEKKYHDRTLQSFSEEFQVGNYVGGGPKYVNNGFMWNSDVWGSYGMTYVSTVDLVTSDLFKKLETGTTARSRIGNKIKVKYLKGSFTFNAAILAARGDGQGGESVVNTPEGTSGYPYLRTTFRFAVVKDLQVNCTDQVVKWEQVFSGPSALGNGIHSELNVDNMGRFVVLEDKLFTLDADTPQKTIPYMIRGSSLGSVRYNGPTGDALTDKGVYVVWSAFTMGVSGTTTETSIQLPNPVGHSRLCFTDD